jgi:hypothetical protein
MRVRGLRDARLAHHVKRTKKYTTITTATFQIPMSSSSVIGQYEWCLYDAGKLRTYQLPVLYDPHLKLTAEHLIMVSRHDDKGVSISVTSIKPLFSQEVLQFLIVIVDSRLLFTAPVQRREGSILNAPDSSRVLGLCCIC